MYCKKCSTEKEETFFSLKNKRTGTRSTICKECHKSYVRGHYYANKEVYQSRAWAYKKVSLVEKRRYVIEYLKTHPCVDCGESDIVVLEFDHRSQTEKYQSVAEMMKGSISLKRIISEIEKCDVRCANCHRRKTANQFSWYRSIAV